MSLNSVPHQYKAFTPEKLGKRYKQIMDGLHSDILGFIRHEKWENRDVEAFEIADAKVIRLEVNGEIKKVEQHTRRWYKLTTNSQGELCYLAPPNNIKVINRTSKPLFLTEETLAAMEKDKGEIDLGMVKLMELRQPSRDRVWQTIMNGFGQSKKPRDEDEEDEQGPLLDCVKVSFVVADSSHKHSETIDTYVETIIAEINLAATQNPRTERILCNGAVKSNGVVLDGVRQRLEKLGYSVRISNYPDRHSGHKSHKRILVEKILVK